MDWFDPSPHIENSQALTNIFGYWPTFHDAEIHELNLTVAEGEPWVVGSESPVVEMLIHVFEMTKDVTPEGYFILRKHTLSRLRFRNVEGLQLSDLRHQNCIFELIFGMEPATYGPIGVPASNLLTVKIDSSCGLTGEFKCQSAAVISAQPCDEDGHLIATTA